MPDDNSLEEKYLTLFKDQTSKSQRSIRSYKLNKSTIRKLRLLVNRIYEKTGRNIEVTEVVNLGLEKYVSSICNKLEIQDQLN